MRPPTTTSRRDWTKAFACPSCGRTSCQWSCRQHWCQPGGKHCDIPARCRKAVQEQRQCKLLDMYKSPSETVVGKIGLDASVKKYWKFKYFLKAGASTYVWNTIRYSAKDLYFQRKTAVGKNVGKNMNGNVGKQSTGHTSKKVVGKPSERL